MSNTQALVERLPAEIRQQIMLTASLEDLKSLVLSSPVFHAQYRANREFLLPEAVHGALHDIMPDVLAVYQTQAADQREDEVVEYLNTYPEQQEQDMHTLTLDQCADLFAFHVNKVVPMAEVVDGSINFSAELLLLPDLSGFVSGPDASLDIEPRNPPKARPGGRRTQRYKALYRFLLGNNFFVREPAWPPDHLEAIQGLFLSKFSHEEVEEIYTTSYVLSVERPELCCAGAGGG
ncbi:hypothetical protein K461DRAFT_274547 [Myriangium duriaei CBS 260.36]|uniref:Uncharacterized protein n=1 Tax=Myriangium duriaei CBS 260.36 TaxID=1168546 RepID=A0A9P4MJT2_9PEZI|nr:hypothetical protein K461DRAFT_274547 [Myriangium duriaei CBS 260.36]